VEKCYTRDLKLLNLTRTSLSLSVLSVFLKHGVKFAYCTLLILNIVNRSEAR
jgi:hypothetical protein